MKENYPYCMPLSWKLGQWLRKNLPLFGSRKNAGRRELTFRHRILGKVDISSCCD